MTDSPHIISQRRRLAMACGCRDRVRAGAVSGQIEGLSLRDEQLWAKIGDEHGYSWVPAEAVVVSYHVTPPPAGPASDVSPIPPQGELGVTECTVLGWGRVEVPHELQALCHAALGARAQNPHMPGMPQGRYGAGRGIPMSCSSEHNCMHYE
jgi:hypothetical protein